MTDHIKDAGESGTMPDGWYFGDYGYNYYAPDLESGMQTYVTKVQQYGVKAPGAKTLEYTGFGGPAVLQPAHRREARERDRRRPA